MIETVQHLLWECENVTPLSLARIDKLLNTCKTYGRNSQEIDTIVLIFKQYFYATKFKQEIPTFMEALARVSKN